MLKTFKPPMNMPKTESVLARVGRPAPIFRPPGAAELDYGSKKTSDHRYRQQAGWQAATPQPQTSKCMFDQPSVQ